MAERWWWELKDPLEVKPGEPFDVKVKRQAIPIIFIPGIMGSRLRQAGSKDIVWDPDRDLWMLFHYGMIWQRAGTKKKALVGEKYTKGFLEVPEDDAKHNKKLPAVGAERGWGGIFWGTYKDIVLLLNEPKTFRECAAPVGLFFHFPVYCFGYDWTGDAGDAGDALAKRIQDVLKKHADQQAKKVILVTHSMGGLVARAACGLSGAGGDVLGVVHGVQPVHGSAAAYWRMKGGFERRGLVDPSAWVLGTDGPEVTGTLTAMPGGLALLPNQLYEPKDWLKVWDIASHADKTLPGGDPYETIYKEKEAYWRLVNPAYLVAAKEPPKRDAMRPLGAGPDRPWNDYLQNLARAKAFHEDLAGNLQHAETHWFLGKGLGSAGTVTYAHKEYVFRGEGSFPAVEGEESNRDGFVTYVKDGKKLVEVRMGRPGDDGDGTVPVTSANALKQQGESHDFTLPGESGKPAAEFDHMEHQSAYGRPEAQKFVVGAIQRLCLLQMKRGGP